MSLNQQKYLILANHVDRSIKSSKNFLTTNINGTYNILEAIRSHSELIKNNEFMLHHISTDEVYGDIEVNSKPPIENSPYNPSSPYSATKASSDMLVMAWNRTYKIPCKVTAQTMVLTSIPKS